MIGLSFIGSDLSTGRVRIGNHPPRFYFVEGSASPDMDG